MTFKVLQKTEKNKKPNNLECKLETCSEIPCSQEQKQLNAYCIFFKNVFTRYKTNMFTYWVNERVIASMFSQTLNTSVMQLQWDWRVHSLWRVNSVILWLAVLVWLWQCALCDVPQGWVLGINSRWDLHKTEDVTLGMRMRRLQKTLIAIETVPVLMWTVTSFGFCSPSVSVL